MFHPSPDIPRYSLQARGTEVCSPEITLCSSVPGVSCVTAEANHAAVRLLRVCASEKQHKSNFSSKRSGNGSETQTAVVQCSKEQQWCSSQTQTAMVFSQAYEFGYLLGFFLMSEEYLAHINNNICSAGSLLLQIWVKLVIAVESLQGVTQPVFW